MGHTGGHEGHSHCNPNPALPQLRRNEWDPDAIMSSITGGTFDELKVALTLILTLILMLILILIPMLILILILIPTLPSS